MDEYSLYYEDNFLPNFYLNTIKQEVFRHDFPWYFNENIAGRSEDKAEGVNFAKSQYGFYYTCFDYNYGWSNSSAIFRPLVPAITEKFGIEIESLMRIRIGMLTNIGESASHYPHVDYPYPHRTVLLYLNESDGDTIFYNEFFEKDIEDPSLTVNLRHSPKENRAVLFNGLQYHSSSAPTSCARRMTININFISK